MIIILGKHLETNNQIKYMYIQLATMLVESDSTKINTLNRDNNNKV